MQLRVDAESVERYRLLAGLLRGELAARAGIHRNQITRINAGLPVGVRVARALARVMGRRVRDIAVVLPRAASASD